MSGFNIFVHSVKMVLRNLQQAVQIALVPALIGAALIFALIMIFDIPLDAPDTDAAGLPDGTTGGSVFGFFVCVVVVLLTTMFWIVVSWHRFILLEEYPTGFVPQFRSDRIFAYFGRALLLGVLAIVAALPALFIIMAIIQASAPFGFILFLVFSLAFMVGFYRFSLILPAVAIGKPLGLSEAWQATADGSGAIFMLILTSFVFQIVVQIVSALLMFIPVVGILVVLVTGMLITPLINVSILTTLYGVFVEKRELT